MLYYIKYYGYIDSPSEEDKNKYITHIFPKMQNRYWMNGTKVTFIPEGEDQVSPYRNHPHPVIEPEDIEKHIIKPWKDAAIKAMRDAYEQFRKKHTEGKKDEGDKERMDRLSPKKRWTKFVNHFNSKLFTSGEKTYSVPGVSLTEEQLIDIARIKYFKFGLNEYKSIERKQEEWIKWTENGKNTHRIYRAFLHRYKQCIAVEETHEQVLKSNYQHSVWQTYAIPIYSIACMLLLYKFVATINYLRQPIDEGLHTGYVDKLYYLSRNRVLKFFFGSRYMLTSTDPSDYLKNRPTPTRTEFKSAEELRYTKIFPQDQEMLDKLKKINGNHEERKKIGKEIKKLENKKEQTPQVKSEIQTLINNVDTLLKEKDTFNVKRNTQHNYFNETQLNDGPFPYDGIWNSIGNIFHILTSYYPENKYRKWVTSRWWYKQLNECMIGTNQTGEKTKAWGKLLGIILLFLLVNIVFIDTFRRLVLTGPRFVFFLLILLLIPLWRWFWRKHKQSSNPNYDGEDSWFGIFEDLWLDKYRYLRYQKDYKKITSFACTFVTFFVLIIRLFIRSIFVVIFELMIYFFNIKAGRLSNWLTCLLLLFVVVMLGFLCRRVLHANRDPTEAMNDEEQDEFDEFEFFNSRGWTGKNGIENNIKYHEVALITQNPEAWGNEEAFHIPKFEALFGLFRRIKGDESRYTVDGCINTTSVLTEESSYGVGPFLVLGCVIALLAAQLVMGRATGADGDGVLPNVPTAKNLRDKAKGIGNMFTYKVIVGIFMIMIVVLTVLLWYIEYIDDQVDINYSDDALFGR